MVLQSFIFKNNYFSKLKCFLSSQRSTWDPLHPNFFVSRSCQLHFRILEIPSWTGAHEVPCCTAVYALPSENLPTLETQECLLRRLHNVTRWKCLATWLIDLGSFPRCLFFFLKKKRLAKFQLTGRKHYFSLLHIPRTSA